MKNKPLREFMISHKKHRAHKPVEYFLFSLFGRTLKYHVFEYPCYRAIFRTRECLNERLYSIRTCNTISYARSDAHFMVDTHIFRDDEILDTIKNQI